MDKKELKAKMSEVQKVIKEVLSAAKAAQSDPKLAHELAPDYKKLSTSFKEAGKVCTALSRAKLPGKRGRPALHPVKVMVKTAPISLGPKAPKKAAPRRSAPEATLPVIDVPVIGGAPTDQNTAQR